MSHEVYSHDGTELDGFISDDGKHHVRWEEFEILPNEFQEGWYCLDHQKIYFGGCNKSGAKEWQN